MAIGTHGEDNGSYGDGSARFRMRDIKCTRGLERCEFVLESDQFFERRKFVWRRVRIGRTHARLELRAGRTHASCTQTKLFNKLFPN